MVIFSHFELIELIQKKKHTVCKCQVKYGQKRKKKENNLF